MKKHITLILALFVLSLFTPIHVFAQSVNLVNSTFSNISPAPTVNSSGDGTTVYTITGASVINKSGGYNSTSYPCVPAADTSYPVNYRFGSTMAPQFPTTAPAVMTTCYMKITPTGNFVNGGKVTLTVSATSSGGNFQLGDLASGTLLGEGTVSATGIRQDVVITLPSTYSGSKTLVFGRKSTTLFLHAIRIDTYPASPSIALTSGTNPGSAMETVTMTPSVYTYSNVSSDANVLFNWYTDNTYSATTTAPSGLSIAQNTTAKTITVSGIPPSGSQETYYYQVSVNETGGNSINGSIVVSPYVAPTPSITGPNVNTQYVRAGETASAAITVNNSTGATVTGLPTGLSGNYSSGTYTISGTVNSSVTPGDYIYTVKATPMSGYTGADITFNDTIAVRNADAARVLYLAASTNTPSQDLLLSQFMTKLNYIVTKRAPINNPAPTDYSPYDLIVLHETLTGGDASTSTNEVSSIKNVDKPILNTKSFFYTYSTTSSSNRWGWGTPNSVGSPKGVKVMQPAHPIFSGVTITDSLYIYNTATAKNVQCSTADKIGGYNLAVGATGAAGVAIHELPATIRLGAGKTSKYLLISLLTGKYNDLTGDALKLLDNAAQYLLTGTQFSAPSLDISTFNVNSVNATIDNTAKTVYEEFPISTDLSAIQPAITLAGVGTTVSPASGAATNFTNSYATPINYTVTDGINTKVYAVVVTVHGTGLSQTQISGVTFDGKIIHNASNIDLQVFDVTGRRIVSSNQNINMSSASKGVYVVKSSIGTLKIAK